MDQLTPDSESKRCPDCGAVKPLDQFTLSKKNRDGRGTYCRPCFSARYRAHRERKAARDGREIKARRIVPEGFKYCSRCDSTLPIESFGSNRSARDGRAAYCRPCHNAAGKETRERLYGGSREYHLWRRYGISSADVDAMINAQGGTCAVCDGKPEHVDHDHATGEVRGILCFNCNQALGNVRDDLDVLTGLRDYLLAHRIRSLGAMVTESRLEGLVVEYFGQHHFA